MFFYVKLFIEGGGGGGFFDGGRKNDKVQIFRCFSKSISYLILAGGRGGAQTVERYVPPPPPTTEADIFGEAVSKGENFGKYHRTQVRCTPEGNKIVCFYPLSIQFII